MQLYHPRHKTAHTALQRLFLQLRPLNSPRYQTDTISHCTTRDTLENIHAPGHAQPIQDTTATPGRCTDQHSPPIIIRYIRGQTMPAAAGSAPTVCGSLASATPAHLLRGQRLSLYKVSPAGQHPGTLHPVRQSSGRERSGRRGTIGGYRRISFRAIAR